MDVISVHWYKTAIRVVSNPDVISAIDLFELGNAALD
jgi:hypothetical protein